MNPVRNALIIDDDETIREMLVLLCERHGIAAKAVFSLKDVNAIINGDGKPYDLFFVDLILPEMSGWDILRMIRETPSTKDTFVVVLSGAIYSEEEKEKLLRKANCVMNKQTFSVEGFKDVLRKCRGE